MAAQFNQVILCGNLGADPFYKVTDSGRYFTSFRLFVNRTYYTKGADGNLERKEATDAPLVQCWGKNAERMAKYLKKGRNVMIVGHIETRMWEDEANPEKKNSITVVMCDDFKFLDAPKKTDNSASVQDEGKFEAPSDDEVIKDVNI